MEFVEKIEKEEYEAFVSSAPKTHFMQSYYFGEIRKEKHFIPHYVGLKKDGKLICSALLLEKKLLGRYSYFYAPRGYVINYEDLSLLETFTLHLRQYAKRHHAIFIKIDPDIKRRNLDSSGNVVGKENHEDLILSLQNMGYRHLGFNVGFDREQPRFTFRLDLNPPMDVIYSSFHPTTRKILNRGNRYGVVIKKGTEEDIFKFYQTMQDTAKREGLLQAPLSYYQTFYHEFHEAGLGDLYLASVNTKQLKDVFLSNQQALEQEIKEVEQSHSRNLSKRANQIKELSNQLQKLKSDFEEIKKLPEEEMVLSSIITVKYKDTVWTVHGGNSTCLMNLNANYLLYYQIIQDAHKEGYKQFDFFGTCGEANPSRDNPIFGIHSFKKRFGGEYTEFIGEFDYVVSKPLYFLFTKLVPIYRKIKRYIKIRKER